MIANQRSYSAAFERAARKHLPSAMPLAEITEEWARGGSTGAGIKVAVIDSGVEADHPAVGGAQGYADISGDGLTISTIPHDDLYGHGTACAGIIRKFAPDCAIYSVRVLGQTLSGRGSTFVAGLQWAIDHGMDICNLSLGTTRATYFGELHELVDRAHCQGTILVAAANNAPVASFPSVFASVIGVAAHDDETGDAFYYNASPPVEFGAPGINVRVAWKDGTWLTTTGNSFAAPHITGRVAQILSKHPGLAPFEVKTILRSLAANAGSDIR